MALKLYECTAKFYVVANDLMEADRTAEEIIPEAVVNSRLASYVVDELRGDLPFLSREADSDVGSPEWNDNCQTWLDKG